MSLFSKGFSSKNVKLRTINTSEQDKLDIINYIDDRGRRKYAFLLNIKNTIEENCHKLRESNSQTFITIKDIFNQLDNVTDEFLQFYKAKMQYEELIKSSDIEKILKDILEIEEQMKNASDKFIIVLQKRFFILEKRKEKFNKIKENLEILKTQLLTIEDIFDLMYEQSLSVNEPEQIVSQVQYIIEDFKIAEETIAELNSLYQ